MGREARLSEVIWQGIRLSVVGLGLTFATLGLIVVAIIVLDRVFRTQHLIPQQSESAVSPEAGTLERDTEEEAIVAAIVVALAHLRSLDICRSELGAALEAERSPWWTIGRLQQPPSVVPDGGWKRAR